MTKAELLQRIEALSPAEQLRLAADLLEVGKVDVARQLVLNVHDVLWCAYGEQESQTGRRVAGEPRR